MDYAGIAVATVLMGIATIGECVRTETEASDNWEIVSERDKFTSQKLVRASTASVDYYSCGSETEKSAILIIECSEGEIDIAIHTGCHMHSDAYDISDIEFGLDGGPIRISGARISDGRNALLASGELVDTMVGEDYLQSPFEGKSWAGAKHLLRQLYGHQTLITRTRPLSGPPITATFDITGIKAATEPIRQACGW